MQNQHFYFDYQLYEQHFALILKGAIPQGVDGFAFERIDGASIFLGVLEAGVAEERGNSLDVGSVLD